MFNVAFGVIRELILICLVHAGSFSCKHIPVVMATEGQTRFEMTL